MVTRCSDISWGRCSILFPFYLAARDSCMAFFARQMAGERADGGLMKSHQRKWFSISQRMKIVAYCGFFYFKLSVISPSSLRIAYFIIFLLITEVVIHFLHRLPIRIEWHTMALVPHKQFVSLLSSRDRKSWAGILHFMKLRDGIEFLWSFVVCLSLTFRHFREGIWDMVPC